MGARLRMLADSLARGRGHGLSYEDLVETMDAMREFVGEFEGLRVRMK